MTALVPLVVLLPLLGAAVALISGRRPRLQRALTVIVLAAVLAVSIVLLVAVVVVVGALSFFPALALGPIVEYLMLMS